MAKINRDNNRSRGDGDKKDDDKKGGRASYKAKRSFTRNKGHRDKQKSEPRGPSRKPFGEREWEKKDRPFSRKPTERREGDRPFPRKTGEGRDNDRPFKKERPEAGSRERSEDRKPRAFDRKPDRDNGDRGEREQRRERDTKGEEGTRGDRSEKKSGSFGDRDKSRGRKADSPTRLKYREKLKERGEGRPERGSSSDRDVRPVPWDRDRDERPARREKEGEERGSERRSKPFNKEDRPARPQREGDDRGPKRRSKPFNREDRPARFGERDKKEERPERFNKRGASDDDGPRRVKHDDFEEGRSFSKREEKNDKKAKPLKGKPENEGLIRLNKYLANAGLASRREADTLIQSGAVKVNGVVVDQMGYKIKPGDKVTYGDEAVKGEKKVYLLLNKPKDYITTVDDPRDRKTVMELIQGACRERVYPVGRLDRNTTGLLLFTNDGELTTKLTHPKFGVKKVYHVSLDKNLKTTDFSALVAGIELEDGAAKADDLAFVGEGKKDVGIEVHSGRNRIVRRMFEHLGYAVLKLDRVVFAGLTKKDLPRGKHRFLTPREVSFLKMIG